MADSGKDDFDVLDPESKAKGEEKKNFADSAEKAYNNAKKVTNAVKNLQTKALSGSKIAAIGFWGIVIILIIIIVVGVIGFFTSIPGLMIEKLKEIAQNMIDAIESFYTTEADAYINEEDIVELANYLEEMEYDLIGYGFIEPDEEYEAEYLTYIEVQEKGFTYFETKEGDSGARYYDENGNAYSGYYYNFLGILIDNSTGQMVTDASYTDIYGMERSTTEYAVSGEGIITEFGDYVDTELLKTYLLSDYRIYSIGNNDETLLNQLYASIKTVFGGYDEAWSKGLLKFYYASEGIATGKWSDNETIAGIISNILNGGTLSDIIKISGTTLYIRSGVGNSYMEFNIEGWADRYGMSLEFLLSLHIATMAPDFVNAVLQSFDTEVQVYLDTTEDATIEFAYVDMLDGTATLSSDSITLDDVETCLEEGKTEGVLKTSGTTTINKKKAQYLLINLPLTSPDNCTGSAQEYVIEKSTYQTSSVLGVDTSSNVLTTYGITEENDSEIYDDFDSYGNYETEENIEFDLDHVAQSIGTGNTDYLDDDYTWFSASDYGYDEDEAEIEEIEKTSFETEVGIVKSTTTTSTVTTETISATSYEIEKVKQSRTWTVEVTSDSGETEEVEYTWVTYKYLIYETGTRTYTKTTEVTLAGTNVTTSNDSWNEIDSEWVDTIVVEFIVREKTTDELVEAGILEYDEETGTYTYNGVEVTKCSNNAEQTTCCSNCQKYVKAVIKALKESDDNYRYYTPYIARVLGSWFRDTYFIIPEAADDAILDYESDTSRSAAEKSMIANSYGDSTLVTVDEEYLADTGEYWTSYEVDSDGDYILYYMYPDGTTSDITLDDFLEQNGYSSQEEAEEDGHVFVKKANVIKASSLASEDESLGELVWSAYTFGEGGPTEWIKITEEDENDAVNDVYDIVGEDYENQDEGGFYYQLSKTNSVTQEEDAQRSETNSTVKWLFKYRKYYTYDGTEETALAIAEDKEVVLTWVESYLASKYGSLTGASTVAGLLGNFGRSALRQAYSSSSITFDWSEVSEQWLEWQLDMYYSGIVETDAESHYVLDELYFVEETDDEGNVTGLSVTTNESEADRIGDPRDPDLISTVNIEKSSLDAFTILENTRNGCSRICI